MPRPDPKRYQPGMKSVYGGMIIDRGGGDTVRVIPTVCARCRGAGRLGDEVFCSICQGLRYTDPSQAYEPYYETNGGLHRANLPANRSYSERAQHPAHRAESGGGGVSVRSAGRRK